MIVLMNYIEKEKFRSYSLIFTLNLTFFTFKLQKLNATSGWPLLHRKKFAYRALKIEFNF